MARDIKICIEEFIKFYNLLVASAPKDYTPWFFICEKNNKNPIGKVSWHGETARIKTMDAAINLIEVGYNIGIAGMDNDPLVIIDIDNKNFINQMPCNSLINISRKRDGCHGFYWKEDDKVKMNLPTDDGEIRSVNQYVLSPGSYVPVDDKTLKTLSDEAKNDPLLGYYTVRDHVPPRSITFDELPQFFKDQYNKDQEHANLPKKEYTPFDITRKTKYSALNELKVSDIVGRLPPSKRVGHPLHDSDTDANFSMNAEGTLAFCWRHMVSLNARQFLAVQSGKYSCQDAGTPFKRKKVKK